MHKVLVQVSCMIMIMTGPQASDDVGNKDRSSNNTANDGKRLQSLEPRCTTKP